MIIAGHPCCPRACLRKPVDPTSLLKPGISLAAAKTRQCRSPAVAQLAAGPLSQYGESVANAITKQPDRAKRASRHVLWQECLTVSVAVPTALISANNQSSPRGGQCQFHSNRNCAPVIARLVLTGLTGLIGNGYDS